MALDTPIALFLFNRPDTTREVFEAVRAAEPSRLLLVADGPRPGRPDEPELCAATREVVSEIDWSCEVARLFADDNLGCGRRVSSGLDWVFDSVSEAIVLEDDCLPHPTFFPFAEEMLGRYAGDDRVAMISGTNYFGREAAYFFARYYAIWGWASWARAWKRYDFSMRDWPALRERKILRAFYSDRAMQRYVSGLFDAASEGRIDTWDIQWFYSCLVSYGLCVVPGANLVTNIGFAGTRAPGAGSVGMEARGADLAALDRHQPVVPDPDYELRVFRERLRAPRGERLLARARRARAR